MSLSPKFLTNVATKLELKVSELEQKQLYTNILFQKSELLKRSKNLTVLKRFGLHYNRLQDDQSLLIFCVIVITFSRANTLIQLTTTQGHLNVSLNAGQTGFKGKQKRRRKVVLSRLIQILITKVKISKDQPIAVHLVNVKGHRQFVLSKLQHSFLIRTIISFDKIPYNGCRKPKLRRKKHLKNFKK